VAGGYGSDAEERDMVYLVDKEEADPMATAKDADDIQGWSDLREQIKNDLCMANEKNMMLTLTQINQLIILRNFTTLCLKGIKRIATSKRIVEQWHEGQGVHFACQIWALARHYQKFEQLPIDKQGSGGGRSLFNDEAVQRVARTYLTGLHIGDITPKDFQRALNEQILPSLSIVLEVRLSECTAWQWLYKLGWWRTRLKKGIYMDGHERDNVRKYREEKFLPKMKSFERRMVHWECKVSRSDHCVRSSSGISDKIMKMDFREGSFLKGKLVM